MADVRPDARSATRGAARLALGVCVANLIIYGAAHALWDVPNGFSLLNPASIAVASCLGVLAATVGLILASRLMTQPVALLRVSVLVLTALSLAGPFQAVAGAIPGMPAATLTTGVTMAVLHLLTGGAIAALLPALTHR